MKEDILFHIVADVELQFSRPKEKFLISFDQFFSPYQSLVSISIVCVITNIVSDTFFIHVLDFQILLLLVFYISEIETDLLCILFIYE